MAKKEWNFEPFDIMGQGTCEEQNKDVFALKNPLLEEDDDEDLSEPLLDMSKDVFQTAEVAETEEEEPSFPTFDIMSGDENAEEKEEEEAKPHTPEISPLDIMNDTSDEYVREEEFEEEPEEEDTSPLDVMVDDDRKKEAFLNAVKDTPPEKNVTKEIPVIEKDEEITILKNAFSAVKKDSDSDIFKTSSKSTPPSYERYDTSDFAKRSSPIPISQNTTGAKIIKTIAVFAVCIMTFVIVWLEGGRAYIEKTNEEYFAKMCAGENLALTNPDFAFYLTVDEAQINVPVINSLKTSEFKSFDGKLLYPGTAVTAKSGLHTIITGAPALLGTIEDAKPQYIILQNGKESVKYEVYASHKCDELLRDVNSSAETLTVYVKLSSGDGEVYALHAKPIQ